jgi:hypothetical protein
MLNFDSVSSNLIYQTVIWVFVKGWRHYTTILKQEHTRNIKELIFQLHNGLSDL